MTNKMKASEVIKNALNSHYSIKKNDKKEIFMCHAIIHYICKRDNLEFFIADKVAGYVLDTFMPIIESEDTSVLVNYLKETNKKYANLSSRFGHYTPACFKIRVKFWTDHIEFLEKKGL